MLKPQNKRNLLKLMLTLIIVTVMLTGTSVTLLAVQQDEFMLQAYEKFMQNSTTGSIEIEPLSGAPLIWRHWVATPNQVVIPMGQDYVDMVVRMEWAEAPLRPVHTEAIGLLFPYRALSFVPGSALPKPGLPGYVRFPTDGHMPPGFLPPETGFPPGGLSTMLFVMPIVDIWPPQPGWEGEIAYSFRFAINPEHLQNPGDAMSIRLSIPESGHHIVPVMTYKTIVRGPLNTPCQDTNLARDYRGAVMTASSEGIHRRAEFTNNGVHNSMADSWIALGVAEEWLMVDFGKVNNFNSVRIYQAGTRIRDYRFEHSIDGVNWTVFHTGDHMRVQSPDHDEVRVENAIQVRFIRLVSGRSNQPTTPIAIHEFEVYYLP